jgi:hypothetical protein
MRNRGLADILDQTENRNHGHIVGCIRASMLRTQQANSNAGANSTGMDLIAVSTHGSVCTMALTPNREEEQQNEGNEIRILGLISTPIPTLDKHTFVRHNFESFWTLNRPTRKNS